MAPINEPNGATGAETRDSGDSIDWVTFRQILDLDEGESNFSQGIVFDFFGQAETTFEKIESALALKDLKALSDLGHYLKGSSATLGFIKVMATCEKIQRYGKMENLDGSPGLDPEVCLVNIRKALHDVKAELAEVTAKMRNFYGIHNQDKDAEYPEDAEENEA